MQTKYGKQFKIEAVKKALSRTPGTPLRVIARSLNVKHTTLHGWIKAMENKKLIEIPPRGDEIEKSPCHWTIEERFEAILEASRLSEEELGEYCRKKGIFPHHLTHWKAEFINSNGTKKADNHAELKELKNENKALAVELRRKEKALAEAASLLILKKKVHDLWKSEEDD